MGTGSEILLAEPRGFCAGVDRAIEIVERALAKFGRPIYVRHEIVHNTYVVNDLKAKGAIFIEDLAEVPPGATLVFSAHGVSRAVRDEATRRGFSIFDATCPLVTKVHVEVAKLHKEGYDFIMIGHKGHPEVEGTMGQLDGGIYLVDQATFVGVHQWNFLQRMDDGSMVPGSVPADGLVHLIEDPELKNTGFWSTTIREADQSSPLYPWAIGTGDRTRTVRQEFRVPVGTVVQQFNIQ